MDLTQDYLKEILDYNPETGLFTWRETKQGRNKKVGTILNTGYLQIVILYKKYSAHRLALFYMTGKWPYHTDHINHNRADNRIVNLRECNASQNGANRTIGKTNTSGYKGVYKKTNLKWYAQVCYLGKSLHLGIFTCPHKAAEAYNVKALELFGDFAYVNVITE